MSNSVLAAQVRARMWLDGVKRRVAESEVGQGAAEYAGVIVVAAILVLALVAGVKATHIDTAVTNKINEILNAK